LPKQSRTPNVKSDEVTPTGTTKLFAPRPATGG
jgi:hypothetical protein